MECGACIVQPYCTVHCTCCNCTVQGQRFFAPRQCHRQEDVQGYQLLHFSPRFALLQFSKCSYKSKRHDRKLILWRWKSSPVLGREGGWEGVLILRHESEIGGSWWSHRLETSSLQMFSFGCNKLSFSPHLSRLAGLGSSVWEAANFKYPEKPRELGWQLPVSSPLSSSGREMES